MASKLNYSKRAKGQSRREYAAQMSGGKLNYKTGKISVPKKSSTVKSSKSSDPYAKYTAMGSWEEAANAYKKAQGLDQSADLTGTGFDQAMHRKYNPGAQQGPLMPDGKFYSKESSDSQRNANISSYRLSKENERDYQESQRQKAAKASSPKINKTSADYGGGVKGWIKSTAQNLINTRNQSNDAARSVGGNVGFNRDWGISELLGIPMQDIINESLGINSAYAKTNDPSEIADRLRSKDVSILEDIAAGRKANIINDRPSTTVPDDMFETDIGYFMKDDTKDERGTRDEGDNRQKSRETEEVTSPEITWNSQEDALDNQVALDYNNLTKDDSPVQTSGGTVPKTYGSGSFGNGAGVTTMGLNDEEKAYIKSMRRQAKGDFGMKDAQDNLERILNSINDQYAEETRITNQNLNQANNENMARLLGLFSAYGTADSEQRMQTQSRANTDYLNQMTEASRRIGQARNQDIAGARSKAQEVFNQIRNNKSNAKNQVDELIYKLTSGAREREMAARERAMSAGKSRGGSSGFTPLQAMNLQQDIYDAIDKGATNWTSGLDNAYAKPGGRESILQAINSRYGDYLDQGSIEELYNNYLSPGWEERYWKN